MLVFGQNINIFLATILGSEINFAPYFFISYSMHNYFQIIIKNLPWHLFPTFLGHPTMSSPNHVNKLINFCQYAGVHDTLTASHLFPLTLSLEVEDLYPTNVRSNLFNKFICDFPPLPLRPQPQFWCNFCESPHDPLKCPLLFKSKRHYKLERDNPILSLGWELSYLEPASPTPCEEATLDPYLADSPTPCHVFPFDDSLFQEDPKFHAYHDSHESQAKPGLLYPSNNFIHNDCDK